jgi:uncharacterized protein YbjT (DUF2867 family)
MPSTLHTALEGVHTTYYLIHNMTHGHGYTQLELDSARAFASAAKEAGAEHIIYLGGLADPEQHIAPHMRSRIETGRVLREGKVPVTEFRAGVITGSGSISFEMIRFMTELFPVVLGPLWLKNQSQPIAIQNVIDYLFAALTNPNGRGGVFEIGGPDITTYGDLMMRYAQIRGLKRRMFLIPGVPLWFMALGVGLMTPVPYRIAYALIGGLSADSIVKHPDALKVFPEVKLIDYDTATEDALAKTNPSYIEHVWDHRHDFGSLPPSTSGKVLKTSNVWTSLKHEGCFVDHRETLIQSRVEKVIRVIERSVEQQMIIETTADSAKLLLHSSNRSIGEEWIEWRISPIGSLSFTYLTQTVFFCPHGLPGFLYWFFFYPFLFMNFRGLMKTIAKRSET